jgi:phage/plasmid-like protein (TIGR03299 family)
MTMAHEVETMAYTNQEPWHGLGTHIEDAPSVDEMLIHAGLDWEVEKQPMYTMIDKKKVEVPNKFALVRSSDKSILDVVGKVWNPIQNAEAFEFFRDFVEAGDATMETAGSLKDGRYVWGLANLNASFKLPGNDEVKGYLLVGLPHEQGKSLIIRPTAVRVVCNNTLSMALRESGDSFRFSHRMDFDASAIQHAKETLGIAREQIAEFETHARILQRKKLDEKEVVELLASIMAPKNDAKQMAEDFTEHGTPRMNTIMDAYYKAPGAQPGTAWGALNAVTYWTDHLASRTQDKRLTNAWLGKTARQKDQVKSLLLSVS